MASNPTSFKYSRPIRLAFLPVLLVGSLLLIGAFVPAGLGMDPDGRWGPYHRLLVWAGTILFATGLFPWSHPAWMRFYDNVWLPRVATPFRQSRFNQRLRIARRWRAVAWWFDNPVRTARILIAILLAACAVLYTWYATVGYWSPVVKHTNYYPLLADAFRHGQLALRLEPDPALARLADPYELAQREGLQYPWDISYFKGKYYLYWGPSPVLGQFFLEALSPAEVQDNDLIVLYALGLIGMISGILLHVWRRFFPGVSPLALAMILCAAAFANPILWQVGRSMVYEIAVVAGQFYLLAGLWAALPLLYGEPLKGPRLALAATCWVLAVGARSALAIPVIFLAGWCAWRLLGGRENRLGRLFALGTPLALGAAGLMVYNYLRFGSLMDFGQHYQLGGLDQYVHGDLLFRPAYVPINLFNYLFNPLDVLARFPFIETRKSTLVIPGLGLSAPNFYGSQSVAGILVTIPFLLSLIALAILLLFPKTRGGIAPALRRLIVPLGITALLALGVVLFFFSCSMRYAMDSVPTLLILSGMGALALLDWARQAGHRGWAPWLILALVLANVAIGLLLGLTGESNLFERYNPALFQRMAGWFGV